MRGLRWALLWAACLGCASGIDSASIRAVGVRPASDSLMTVVCLDAVVTMRRPATRVAVALPGRSCCDTASDSTVRASLGSLQRTKAPIVCLLALGTEWSIDAIAARLEIERPPEGWRRLTDGRGTVSVALGGTYRVVEAGNVNRCPIRVILRAPADMSEDEWNMLTESIHLFAPAR